MIQQDQVDVLVAGFASAEREAIRPIVDQFSQLYFYTNQYEGGVADANTFCTGPVCEQQVIPTVQYMVENFGPNCYTIAADYNFGQLTAAWTRAFIPLVGGNIVGEEFIPLSVSEFSQVIARIQQTNPDWVMTLLVGQNHHNYYPQAAAAGLKYPMASTVNMAQGYEHKRFPPPSLANMHNAIQYQMEVPTDAQPRLRPALDGDVPGRPVHRRDGAEHLLHHPSLRQGGAPRRTPPSRRRCASASSSAGGSRRRRAACSSSPAPTIAPIRSGSPIATSSTMSASCATGR